MVVKLPISACVLIAFSGGCSDVVEITRVNFTMLKLYNFSEDTTRYWEAWENEGVLTVHWGDLGDHGTTKTITLETNQSISDAISTLAEKAMSEGFRELNDDELVTFVIQYRLDTWGSTDDLNKRYQIEDLMNECLGWTGNGHCDGGDIGSGSMNIWCYVVNPHLAARSVINDLRDHGMLAGAVMAYSGREEDFVVLYPEGFEGDFSTL